jgi:triacylglycerol esterase/lipase EstA (alpha/beta hydrolase family)
MNYFTTLIRRLRTAIAKHLVKTDSCHTRYPVLLVHGIAFRDDMVVSSWGGVPDYLRCGGATVYLADTEAWASCSRNGEIIRDKIASIISETKADKVNIIAHSKGGIDARYAISAFNLNDQVASLTTVGSPHRGTCIADIVVNNLPESAEIVYDAVDSLGKLMGDKHPESSQAVRELTRAAMQEFNQKYPDSPKVYYQSYAVEMTNPLNDLLFSATYLILKKQEGANDGMVSKASCQWGDFQGTTGSKIPGVGISHLQITGAVLDVIAGVNIPLLYVEWVSRLKQKGW